ncbi:MAG TPA: vWA domain-containing protein, partial [Prolixibacteraceae bacterium]|nr:vWA domain-containing protein [Prolixibacteraceae bacterium]
MKKKIFTSPTITVARNLWLLIILLTGFSIGAFSQNGIITLNKTVTPKANDCGAFDVQLTIAGNPPDRPIDVIIVIDRSGSMLGTPLSNAKDAAINFATNVINASNPYRANRVGVVSYSSTAILETGLTSNLTTITNEINSLNASGSTNIQDGFVEAETELNSNAGHNCETIRAIVLLTDGVANEDNGGGCGTSVQCAISAGVDAQLCTSGEGCTPDYDTWVYTIGLFGSISGGTQTTAESTLIACQNGGYWFTESSADLNGIYNQIFGSLLWAAKSVSGQAMVVETVDSDFSITAGPVVNEGTAGAVGQTISWNLAAVYGETASLTYTIQSNNTSNCGSTTASNSTMHYETVSCNDTTVTFTNPTICVPCLSASANASVSSSSCCAIDYSISASESTACASGETFTYAWEFYDVTASAILGTSATASGTFTVPDCSTRFGHTLRATPTVTFVNGSVCSMTRQADPITFTFSDTSPSTANAGPDQSKCSG